MSLQRVLLAVHHYPPRRVGGAELLTQRLARWLTRHGVQVRVVCVENVERGSATKIHARDEMDGAVQVQRLDVTFAPEQRLPLWFDEPALREQFALLCADWRPDIVHLVSGYLMGTAPLDTARSHNIASVVTLTDFWFLCPTIQLLRGDGSLCAGPEALECARCLYDERRVFRTIDRRAPNVMRAFWKTANAQTWLGASLGLPPILHSLHARRDTLIHALNQADAIISLTRFLADLHIANGVTREKFFIKPDCIEPTDFDAVEFRPPRTDEIHFGYLGQITPIKGVDVLLRAFLEVEKKTKKPIRLHVYGNTNAEPSYARALQHIAGDASNITFHGAYEHRRALALMNEMSVIVVPSLWYENSPRVIFEAFAAKRPVIGTRVGGIAEVVRDKENGLLFERDSVQDLARVMLRIVQEPALLQDLAQNIPAPRTLDEDMRDVLRVYETVMPRAAVETPR